MATPISVALPSPGLNDTVMSAFDAAWTSEVARPIYSRKMIDQYNGQGIDLFLMWYNLGMKRAEQNVSGWDWERGFIQGTFASNGNVSGAAGATITITLNAADVDGDYSFPVVNEIWRHVPSGVTGIILTKPAANSITIRPLLAADSFSVTAGDKFVQIGTAWAQGTAQPDGKQSFWQKYNWYTQIRKHTYEATGTMLTVDPQWQSIQYAVGGNSKPLTGYFMEGTDNVDYYHMRDFAYSFFYGQVADNITGVQTSTGLDEQVTARGIVYDAGPTFDRDNLIAFGNLAKKKWSTYWYLALMNGTDLQTLNESLLTDLQNTNIGLTTKNTLSDRYFGGNVTMMEQLTSTFNWQEVILPNGVKFELKENTLMNDPNGAGISVETVNAFDGVNYMIPLTGTQTKDGGMAPNVEFIYLAKDGYNRLFETSFDGRANRVPHGPYDKRSFYSTSEAAWNFRGLTQFGITTSAGS